MGGADFPKYFASSDMLHSAAGQDVAGNNQDSICGASMTCPLALSQIGFSVPDLDRTVAFYREVMGWYIIMPPGGPIDGEGNAKKNNWQLRGERTVYRNHKVMLRARHFLSAEAPTRLRWWLQVT
jgi:hypothetical protein